MESTGEQAKASDYQIVVNILTTGDSVEQSRFMNQLTDLLRRFSMLDPKSCLTQLRHHHFDPTVTDEETTTTEKEVESE